MRIKNLIGATVLDVSANEVGKITDVDFDKEDGKINSIIVSLRKNMLNTDEIEVDYADIKTIGKFVLLSTDIAKDEETETVEVEVE
ncbi:MAG: PRC-barrel domain-containing protein [Methanobrevibacter sp.]|nr:PRC-barrel domain-containing protein [Methanobrevibacter sp.]